MRKVQIDILLVLAFTKTLCISALSQFHKSNIVHVCPETQKEIHYLSAVLNSLANLLYCTVYETNYRRKLGLRVKGQQWSMTGRGWLGTGLLQHFVLCHFPLSPFFVKMQSENFLCGSVTASQNLWHM